MTTTADPVSAIRNLGPASEQEYARAGIHTADQLRELGADAAYGMLLAAGNAPHFIGYYALVMGLQGRPWNDCKGDEKKALRARFDAIKAGSASDTNAAPAGIERILDQIGVGTKRQS
ncbi:TfoX-like protein [Pacificibacter maritimus]|uniref:TfoX-like protein n=1 Tax=Pacificibacter maritimus TaxID=762213 RepID=A0A3N4VCP4_9RHOB|nr:TfoX/Sxy family protein [Pacificibacter maritimus]RPE71610.1 TfoX-like protein [Pacificibacter maritimus]